MDRDNIYMMIVIMGIWLLILGLVFIFSVFNTEQGNTLIVEGFVEELRIDRIGRVFHTDKIYLAIINGKEYEITEKAYNIIKIGDYIKIFADNSVKIL